MLNRSFQKVPRVHEKLLTTLKLVLFLTLESIITSPIQMIYSLWISLRTLIKECTYADSKHLKPEIDFAKRIELLRIIAIALLLLAPFGGVLIVLVIKYIIENL